MKNYKLYEIGGCIRDELLGLKSKDIDFAFEFDVEFIEKFKDEPPSGFYEVMNNILKKEGYEIFLETPNCFTTRAKFPNGHQYEGLTADFVLCRKETYPDPKTRIPKVEIGTLYDDQLRRDFCCNSIAKDDCGNLIDPFDGIKDIKNKILRCPIDAKTSFNDDPLRMLRALRFAITKGFIISADIDDVMTQDVAMWDKFKTVVSRERIRDEIYKMMKHDTVNTMKLLNEIDMFSDINILERIFENDLWLEPTNKKR